ncbi:hypothetical protein [Sinisalibacter aestuarii]|uniref:Uncharacterized protein n=1 Tax=Sinisalibacter aestuarii TaxID=2949426 RepID=A0ABQ5LQA2_9RHOB|nr:hypothetical protein [Sinisalibacter aestuarii]GKY87185.1 hypothetical protein STA1M1_10540 [Sinisalibacter aestuarii]
MKQIILVLAILIAWAFPMDAQDDGVVRAGMNAHLAAWLGDGTRVLGSAPAVLQAICPADVVHELIAPEWGGDDV